MLVMRNILVVMLAVAAILVIWFLGSLLAIGGSYPLADITTRLILCAVILVLALILLFYTPLRRALSRRQRRADLATAERLSQRERLAPIEIDSELRASFTRNLERIDELTFGEGRKRLRGWQLPWFLVMGAPEAGKSTLLRQSGLDFAIMPEPPDEKAGLVPAERASWWAAEGGVLLEANGGYLLDAGASGHIPGWRGLLSLIKEYRPRRPLHGAVIVINLQDLLSASAASRKTMAATLRARMQEMFSVLGARFPIYLVASKADCISGFSEGHAVIPERDRAGFWGGLFPVELDLHDAQSVRVLDDMFAGLLDAAARERDLRLRGDHDVSRRQRIFGFPEQLGFVLPQMTDLMQAVFRNSRFEIKPLLRGLFITSARQGPQAIDIATGRLVAPMKLVVPSVVAAQSGNAAFFVEEIFTRFVFPESGLAGFDARLERRRRGRTFLGMILALLLLGVGSLWAVTEANTAVQRIQDGDEDLIALYNQQSALSSNGSWSTQLNVLNLSQQISGEYRGWVGSVVGFLASGIGRQRFNYINATAGKIYPRALRKTFLPKIVSDMEADMNAALASADSPRLLRTLTAYLMLDDPKHFQADTVRQWVNDDWQRNFLLSPDVRAQLNQHLGSLLALLPAAVPLDQTLIATARQALAELPTADNLYERMQVQAAQDPTLVPFQRGTALGAAAPLSLSAPGVAGLNTQIPGLYTRRGFETYILQRLPDTAATLSQDNWVLGPAPLASSGAASTLLDQVAALYSADYIRYWDGAVRGLQLRQAPDLTTAIDALGGLSGPDSPLARLVVAVAANTNLVQPQQNAAGAKSSVKIAGKQIPAGAVAAATGALASFGPQSGTNGFSTWPGAAIQAHFAPLIALAGGTNATAASAAAAGDSGSTPMDQVRALIAGAYSLLQGVASAPNPQFAALNLLKSQSSGAVGNALSPLMTQASAYPAVVGTLIRQVAFSTSAILADLAGQYISQSWRQAGGPVCQSRIAGRYPFNRSAPTDVALADFQNFFGPGGIMDSFYSTTIAPLGLDAGGALGGTAALLIDPRTLASFQQAIRIRDAFFHNGQLSVPFALTPAHLDPDALSDSLSFNGQQYLYQHEPPRRWDMVWPATNGDPSVTLTITGLKGNPYTQSFSGDWALFRFVSAGMANTFGDTSNYQISFDLSGLSLSYKLSTESLQGAFDPTVAGGFACPQFQ